MDVKESLKKLIEKSKDLLKKLENSDDDDDDDDNTERLEILNDIVECSNKISTEFKSKRTSAKHNGKKSSGNDVPKIGIKLIPIEKLMSPKHIKKVVVNDIYCIELSDSDQEILNDSEQVSKSKSELSVTSETSKASILKSVFTTTKENLSKKKSHEIRTCKVILKRSDLTRIVKAHGLELIPPISGKSKSTKSTENSIHQMDQTLDDGTKTAKPKSNSTSKSDCIKGAKNVCRKSKDSEDDTTSEKCNDGDDKHILSSDDMSKVSKETSKKAEKLSNDESGEDRTESQSKDRSCKTRKRSKVVQTFDVSSDDDEIVTTKSGGNKKSTKSDSDFKDNDSSESEPIVINKRKKITKISSSHSDDNSEAEQEKKNKRRRIKNASGSDSSESEPIVINKRKKITKKSSEHSDDNSEAEQKKKKKRRRIKYVSISDSSDDEKNASRKRIRKIVDEKDLEAATKRANREEMERKKRIEERQKLYNEYYDEEPEKAQEVDKLVLDFDVKTKEVLIEVDQKLLRKLKPHQCDGVKFMWSSCFESISQIDKGKGSGCILAHCMGLGKTLQIVTLVHTLLSHSDETGVHKVLVVCPLNTVLNWVNEFKIWLKHCGKNKYIDIYEISKYKLNRERVNKIDEWHTDGGVLIMGYDMFRNLSSETSKLKKAEKASIKTSLVDPGPDLVVCDEGHLLKNSKTSLSEAVNRIRTLRRIVLTGTPLQNNLNEYYCMVQFVKPNLLGKYNEYLNRFVNPITNGQYEDSTPQDIQMMKKRSHILHKLLDGCVQRQDYSVLAPYLPVKHEYVVSITLTPLQIKLYEFYLQQRPALDTSKPTRSSVLFQDFQNLQRIWTHPRVLRFNSDRYEIKEQKRSDDLSDEDSEGSLKNFIESSTDESEAESTDSSSSSVASDDSRKKVKKPKSPKVSIARRTRANKDDFEEPIEEPQQAIKIENPTEWWMSLCPEEELDNLTHSGKLMLLFSLLEECHAIGDKLLVFSQSLYTLDVIELFLRKIDEFTQRKANADDDDEEIKKEGEQLGEYTGSWSLGLDYFRLDGSTSIANRNLACNYFNSEDNPRARLFLISTRAGSLGINLVGANRVIIFDVSWNPSHDIQGIFRVYRFGQVKPCYIYRLIAMGTMEEKIYERQVTKLAIAKRVIDQHQIDRHYKEKDLMALYKTNLAPSEPRSQPPLPKDRMFALQLQKFEKTIYKYHEHDSLLENKHEETLNKEEMAAAWKEFEDEKSRPPRMAGMGPVASNTICGFRSDVILQLLDLYCRKLHPAATEMQVKQLVPLLLKQLQEKMNLGDPSMYNELLMLQRQLKGPAMAFNNTTGQMSSQYGHGGLSMNNYYPYAANPMSQQQSILTQAQNRLMSLGRPQNAKAQASSNQVIELD